MGISRFYGLFQGVIQRGCDRKAVEGNEKRAGLGREKGGFFVFAHSYSLERHNSNRETFVSVIRSIILYKVALTLTSVEETLVCDHSNESH